MLDELKEGRTSLSYIVIVIVPAKRGLDLTVMLTNLSGLNANSKWYWPCWTSNTEDLLVLQIFFTDPTNSQTFIFIDFNFIYFKNIWDMLEGKRVNRKCPQMFAL